MSSTSIAVALLGVPDSERQALNRIFRLSATRPRAYRIVPATKGQAIQILVVNACNEYAMQVWRKVSRTQRTVPSLLVGDRATGEHPHFVRRPLMAMRVLASLDALELNAAATPATRSKAGHEAIPTLTPQPTRPVAAHAPAPVSSGYRALVVDDSLPVRRQVAQELERAGVEVELAESGEQALEHIERSRFDIVFMDVVMPGLDGYELCKTSTLR